MGVKQLQTFIQKYVPNGYVDVSLKKKCGEFSRKNEGRLPILLIKLNGLLRSFVKDPEEIFCGIRHNVVHEKIEELLKNLSEIAELIFFKDGSVIDDKLPEWMKKQNEQYKKSQEMVSDRIDKRWPLKEMIKTAGGKELISPTSHLKFTEALAQEYGVLKIAMNRECNAEMTQFAHQNHRVIAVLDDDSDFLIYPGKWSYFSLRDMNQETLGTKEYSRNALREELDLSDKELVLLSTLNGNDVISYSKDTYRFHQSLVKKRGDSQARFPAIAKFIKDHRRLFKDENVATEIAKALFNSTNHKLVQKVQASIDYYDIEFEHVEITDETQKFCCEKSFNFVFSVLNFMPITFTLNFYDRERGVNYYESINELFSKQLGIIHNDKAIDPYKIYSKLSHDDPEYSKIKVDKLVPNFSIPPLIKLLDRLQFPEHDNIRFRLLKWLINKKNMRLADLKSIPKKVFLDILVLAYMVEEGFINVNEADIILISIKQVADGEVPKNIKAPETLHPRAFYASILFSKCHIYIGRCLEVTGLMELEKIHNFDGVLFHNLFLEHIDEPFDESVLGDLAQYRYYA